MLEETLLKNSPISKAAVVGFSDGVLKAWSPVEFTPDSQAITVSIGQGIIQLHMANRFDTNLIYRYLHVHLAISLIHLERYRQFNKRYH